VAVKNALAKSKPALFFNSGFDPIFNADLCVACETCIDRCPPEALSMGEEDVPVVDFDRCFGCAVCATGCPEGAITMVTSLISLHRPRMARNSRRPLWPVKTEKPEKKKIIYHEITK